MSLTIINHDPYLVMLTDQAKALDGREAQLAVREEQIKADRTAIAQDRAKLEVAKQHYLAFLASKKAAPEATTFRVAQCGGESGPGVLPPLEEAVRPPIPLPLRMGNKRRQVLDEVATATNGLTTREISERTNVIQDVVRNIVSAEIKEGIFLRHGDRIVMTPAGLDYLNRANAKFGVPQKNTPPATASGVSR